MISEIICAVLFPPLLYILFTYVIHVYKLKDYPSGPFPLPVIGNLYLLSTKPYIDLAELAKKYGNIFGFSFGMVRVVIFNTYETTKEALVTKGNVFAGRPTDMYHLDIASRGFLTIGFSDYGPVWAMVRKIAHNSLKMYGEGLRNIESSCITESEDFHERLRKLNGKPVGVDDACGLMFLNVITVLVFNQRYNEDDTEYKDIIDFNTLISKGLAGSEAVAFMPWLRFFPLKGLRQLRKGIQQRDPYLRMKLLEHKASFDGENIRDVVDSLLKVSAEDERLQKVGLECFTDDHLEMILSDFILGGTETLSTFTAWSILYLLKWPKYQDVMYEEIVNVVGTDRYPNYSDRESLHFVRAVIYESLRLGTLTPLGVPHRSLKKSEIDGKAIPENTIVMFNVWNCHRDSRFWENPDEFYPERWFNDKNEFDIGKGVSFFPFSAGQRACFGQALAKLELFTFLVRLIRDFRLEKVADVPLPNFYGVLGLVRTPDTFSCIFTPRK